MRLLFVETGGMIGVGFDVTHGVFPTSEGAEVAGF